VKVLLKNQEFIRSRIRIATAIFRISKRTTIIDIVWKWNEIIFFKKKLNFLFLFKINIFLCFQIFLYTNIKNNFFLNKNIILIYFQAKNTLNNNHHPTLKYFLHSLDSCCHAIPSCASFKNLVSVIF
jgi:hypothetical protein